VEKPGAHSTSSSVAASIGSSSAAGTVARICNVCADEVAAGTRPFGVWSETLRTSFPKSSNRLPLARGDPANRIGSGDRSGTLGAPTSFRFERWLDGGISESAIGDLIDVARREIGLQGQVNEALDTVEWRARGGLGGAVVSVARRGGRTKVTVHLARTDAAALVVSTSALAGIGAAVGIGAAIGTAAASAGPLGMAGPSRSRS